MPPLQPPLHPSLTPASAPAASAGLSASPAMLFADDQAFAQRLDAQDPLRACRELFEIPPAARVIAAGESRGAGHAAAPAGQPCVYLTGNSLGCMPKGVRQALADELDDWSHLGVEGHLHGRNPWLPYHECFRHVGARLVGARPGEVVMMNSLTVNLHLLMVSFYRPNSSRYKILIEDAAFPSDSYAVASQAEYHGRDAEDAVMRLRPRPGERTLRTEDILQVIADHGKRIALVMLGGVNYLTSQWFDMAAITAAAKAQGCTVGWDLAHAAGNVPLKLHEWGVDFAAWCSYKYLNAGPGAVAGAFVHEEHAKRLDLPRFAGWWGNDPETRFRMGPQFVARQGADGWQLSNPPILAMAPLRVSLDIFDRVGMDALREKSLRLTAYMEWLIDRIPGNAQGELVEIVTPRDPAQRGCALSLVIKSDPRGAVEKLKRAAVVCDFREPNILRAAPVPLYNSYHDVWSFVQTLRTAFA
ncbi:MAG: kynureninase [Planctomycetaceae bacterium]|nr:kynureninase [Planctomycetaceae bacterium]